MLGVSANLKGLYKDNSLRYLELINTVHASKAPAEKGIRSVTTSHKTVAIIGEKGCVNEKGEERGLPEYPWSSEHKSWINTVGCY